MTSQKKIAIIDKETSSNFILTQTFIDKYLLYTYNGAKRFNGKLLNALNKKYNTSYTPVHAWEIYYNLTAPSCKNINCSTNVMPAFFGFIQFKESPFECFRDYCCNSCAQTDKRIIDKGKNTKFKNHGDANFNNRAKSREICLEKYGCEHISQSDIVKQKKIDTCLKNNDVMHPMQSDSVRAKSRESCLEKYGVEIASKSDIVKQKTEETCLEKYGETSVFKSKECKEKSKITLMKNYGVEHQMHSNTVKEKIKETCLEKYGVENPMQDGIIAEKCMVKAKQFKIFKLPSGKEIKFQGYEDQLIKLLLNNHKEEEILFLRKDMPKILYTTSDGKTHRYYPDVFIPSTNTIYEVKSEYTLNKDLDINLRKFSAVKEMGYNFELHVF